MPVLNAQTSAGPYAANGSAVSFPFVFTAASSREVQVLDTSVSPPAIVSPSLYSVSLNADRTGSVVFAAPLVAPATLLILSNPDFTAGPSLAQNGPFLASAVQDGFDRSIERDLVLLDGVNRSLRVPAGETLGAFPSVAQRAGGVLAFDAFGNPMAVSANPSVDTVLRGANGASLIGFQPGYLGARSIPASAKLNETISVTGQPGVDATGIADSTAGVQPIVNWIRNNRGSGTILFPSGDFTLTNLDCPPRQCARRAPRQWTQHR